MNKLAKTAILLAALIAVIFLVLAWSPWLTEEYAKEKVLDYFSQKYNFDKNNILVTSIEKKLFEMHFGMSFPPSGDKLRRSYAHAWINFYGKIEHDELKLLD